MSREPHPNTVPKRPGAAYTPSVSNTSFPAIIDVGGTPIEVARDGREAVSIRFGALPGLLFASVGDVTHWCAEASMLLEVTLSVASGDELQVRSPMLVGTGGRCMSIVRRIFDSGSELLVVVAASPSSMLRDVRELAQGTTTTELQNLLELLRGASAVVPPHDTQATDTER